MDTDQLLDRVVAGDNTAAAALLTRHKQRLLRMVQLRLDARLTRRCDPSDVVQEAMVEAHRRLAHYAEQRPIPFYPWLRGIAWDKLIDMKRRHVTAERRSVEREVREFDLSGDSQRVLVDRLASSAVTASEAIIRREIHDRLQQAIEELPPRDREVIVLRHLEELSFSETAAVLGLSEAAVYSRYRRAIQRLHHTLRSDSSGHSSH